MRYWPCPINIQERNKKKWTEMPLALSGQWKARLVGEKCDLNVTRKCTRGRVSRCFLGPYTQQHISRGLFLWDPAPRQTHCVSIAILWQVCQRSTFLQDSRSPQERHTELCQEWRFKMEEGDLLFVHGLHRLILWRPDLS